MHAICVGCGADVNRHPSDILRAARVFCSHACRHRDPAWHHYTPPRRQKYRTDLQADFVRSLLDYDPQTGVFRWRVTRSATAMAGMVAGTMPKSGSHVVIYIDNRAYKAHRLAWLLMTGEWPQEEVDHRDLNKQNNRWKNLRAADDTQQTANRGLSRSNTSGFKGVHRCKKSSKWIAQIGYRQRRIVLGRFANIDDAVAAYADAAQRLFGEYARVGT